MKLIQKPRTFLLSSAVFLLMLFFPRTAFAAEYSYGSRGTAAYTIQQNLYGLGCEVIPDGIFGKDTKAAMIRYQSDAGLSADGIAGEKTLTRLGEEVLSIQRSLKTAGYLSGKADGIYGPETLKAVAAFQRSQGFSPDGIAGNAGSVTRKRLAGVTGGLKALHAEAKSWSAPLKAAYLPITGGRSFGDQRSDGRQHAGIDYYVEHGAGTPVYAVTSGTVTDRSNTFYAGTGAVTIQSDGGSVIRYGEITPLVSAGERVKKGQRIGTIAANQADGGTMLHLELYSGAASGTLSRDGNEYWYVSGRFNRREDLLDPSWFLQ